MNNGIVFFDLGDSLGEPTFSAPPYHLVGFDVFPFVPDLLRRLRDEGHRLGIISNTGDDTGAQVDAVLAAAGILDFFDPPLRIYSKDVGLRKDLPNIFRLAAEHADLAATPGKCLFVGEDVAERSFASAAGLLVCPHPLLVHEVLAGQALRYVRITVPPEGASADWRTALLALPLVPLQLTGPGGTVVYAMSSERALPELANLRFRIDFLGEPGLPLETDLFILRDDAAGELGFLSPRGEAAKLFAVEGGRLVVASGPEGLVVALPPERSLGELHLEKTRHGHTLKLVPDPALLAPAPRPPGLVAAALAGPVLPEEVATALARIDPPALADRVERYAGVRPPQTDGEGPISSRHIAHMDNPRTVAALASELAGLGGGRLTVRLHRFTHRGRELHNVEAELAGTSPEVVLVTAHLDSTAAQSPPYDESGDPAPGADDDASGTAAVLVLAEHFAALTAASPFARTLRFVLFNAEEEGLVGSRAYARLQRARQAPIVAVLQMDMIGYNRAAPRSWELHAGFAPSPEVEARSLALAQLIRSVTGQVSPALEPPQLYRTQGPGGDPADGRSDHSSFQSYGLTACCASEDFFAGPGPDAPAAEGNPHYHQKDDDFVDAAYAADIARAIAAATWLIASSATTAVGMGPTARGIAREMVMATPRELDTRKTAAARQMGPAAMRAAPATAASVPRVNMLTVTPVTVAGGAAPPATGSLVDRALAFARSQSQSLGFAPGEPVELVPDPIVQRTSTGSAAVHLQQLYRGIPIFQMTRTVRFNPRAEPVDAAGDSAAIPSGFDIEPRLDATMAVRKAAEHLASTGTGATAKNQFGETLALPTIELGDYQPEVIAGFPLPSRPTVLSKGPFENPIPVYLLIFIHPDRPRLAWHTVFTFPDYADQYVVIVAADDAAGEVLFARSTVHRAQGTGRVFEFSPGVADRRMIPFPRPLEDYPVMPTAPLTGFPPDWIDNDEAIGNSTRATLNFSTTTLKGILGNDGAFVFDPSNADADEQKLLNIFYFCNYMHDFLHILGFDEAAGNFQRINFTHTGLGNDPVRARAHSGPVFGTANMATGPDGQPPLMNMGLVTSTNRHTAFDADVVFHEYTHGLTNRLVGGRMNANALDELQSGGMGEGWSDYFALTAQNYFQAHEKTATGDWVVNNPAGIRRAPYDDSYPFKYGDLANSPEVHDIGEVWCAALMMMTRKLRGALGDDRAGYRLAWQMVVDGLKLTQPNPTFLEARDTILRALDDLRTTGRISNEVHRLARRAAWEAFAHFGIGVNAVSVDAGVDGITPDGTLPPEA